MTPSPLLLRTGRWRRARPTVIAARRRTARSAHMKSHAARINSIRIFGYVCLGIWPAFLFGAFMGFDAPKSEHTLGPWLFIVFVLLMPVLILVMPRYARLALAAGHTKKAYALAVLPILPFILPFVIWTWLLASVPR